MIKTVIGDILDAPEDIICHQVNCQNAMGSGVAKVLFTRWPEIKKSYHRYCRRFSSPEKLLGQVQLVEVAPNKQVANIFGQLEFGRDKYRKYTDYAALTKAFNKIRNQCADKSLAFPYGFGCGLANGDWKIVYNMIEIYFKDMDVTIYRLPTSQEMEVAA